MIASVIRVRAEHPACDDAQALMNELSATLAAITGASGRASFEPADVVGDRACFAVARDARGRALGCGALRPMDASVAEIKRMFARVGTAGVGSAVLSFLEVEGARLGYAALRLETRLVNERAVAFYEHRGYVRIANYGKYARNAEAACFEKAIGVAPPPAAGHSMDAT